MYSKDISFSDWTLQTQMCYCHQKGGRSPGLVLVKKPWPLPCTGTEPRSQDILLGLKMESVLIAATSG